MGAQHIEDLKYEDTPDYEYLKALLESVMNREGVEGHPFFAVITGRVGGLDDVMGAPLVDVSVYRFVFLFLRMSVSVSVC